MIYFSKNVTNATLLATEIAIKLFKIYLKAIQIEFLLN